MLYVIQKTDEQPGYEYRLSFTGWRHGSGGRGEFSTARRWCEDHYGLSCDARRGHHYLSRNEHWCYVFEYGKSQIFLKSSKELFLFQIANVQDGCHEE